MADPRRESSDSLSGLQSGDSLAAGSIPSSPDDVLDEADWPFREGEPTEIRVRKRRYVFYFILFTALFSLGSVQVYHSNETGFVRLQRLYRTPGLFRPRDPLPVNERDLASELGVSPLEVETAEKVLNLFQQRVEEKTAGPFDWAVRVRIGAYHIVFSYRIFVNMSISAVFAAALYVRARDQAASVLIARKNERLEKLKEERERQFEEAQRYLEELKAAQSQLLQAEKLASIGRMSATLAHEIRNPMSIIMSAAGMAADDLPAGSPPHQAVELIRAEITRLNRIITELLNFARPKPPIVSRHNLNQLVRGWLYPLAEELQKSNVKLEFEPQIGLPPVKADAEQLYQVFLNLVWNARDALKENNGGVIHVHTEEVGQKVFLVITDDGPGMEREVLQQIWEPFFTTKTAGSGLGLPLVLQLMEGMGGQAYIDSEPERGTKVQLMLSQSLEDSTPMPPIRGETPRPYTAGSRTAGVSLANRPARE